MAFRDTHAAVFAEGYEGDASAELLASYDEDSGLASAALAESGLATEAANLLLVAANAEIQRLRAVNYTLLEASEAAPPEKIEDTDTGDGDTDADEDNPESVDDAFAANKIEEE